MESFTGSNGAKSDSTVRDIWSGCSRGRGGTTGKSKGYDWPISAGRDRVFIGTHGRTTALRNLGCMALPFSIDTNGKFLRSPPSLQRMVVLRGANCNPASLASGSTHATPDYLFFKYTTECNTHQTAAAEISVFGLS